MICSKCNKQLSLQDIKQSKWEQDTEVFDLICPFCKTKNTIKIHLFENKHIGNHYIKLLSQDSSYCNNHEEKHFDYIENSKKEKILKHISVCSTCSEKLEEIRLFEFSVETLQNKQLYDFFLKKAKDTIIDLNKKNFKIKNKLLKQFSFKNEKFNLSELFFESDEKHNGIEFQKQYYKIEKNKIIIGLVSFVTSNNKVILEKIWFKNKETIQKEQKFIEGIKKGKTRILLNTLSKLYRLNVFSFL
jgi:hypothetical protein